MQEKVKKLREKALALPLSPGVYLMKDKGGKIIYIGKAKALKNRVSSYFIMVDKHLPKVRQMVSQVDDFDYILTDSEFEALVLECNLIKQHMPKYNILLKDDKGYNYIKITKETYPRILPCKQKDDDKAEYIGPYTSAYSVEQTIDNLRKIFKLPSCSIKFSDKNFKKRPCLNYYINLCLAPCCKKVSKEEYNICIKQALKYLKEGSLKTKKELGIQMKNAAENLEFEKAAKLRDKINAIEKINEKQKIIISEKINQDVIAAAKSENKICITVIKFRSGRLCFKESFFEDLNCDEVELKEEFIKRYYTISNEIPKQIIIDSKLNDAKILETWLSDKAKFKVQIKSPIKGKNKDLIGLCQKNAYETLAKKIGRYTGKNIQALEELKAALNLKNLPKYIEAYDISNLGSAAVVAGMIVFENAKPLKKAYRKFKIKNTLGQDDYSCMREVLTRRLNEFEKSREKASGFSKLPDLILLDGGSGHVNACQNIVKKYNIPIFGMVKDSKHKTRAITKDKGEITIPKTSQAMKLITNIQNEVHRFAITYHRKLRDKASFSSNLINIPGVGEKRASLILKNFKNLNEIKNADLSQLIKAGIDKKTANNILKFFDENY